MTDTNEQKKDSSVPRHFAAMVNGKMRYFDPWKVHRKLFSFPGFQWPDIWNNAVVNNDNESMDTLTDAVSESFDIPKFDQNTGEGLLESDAIMLLDLFTEYCLDVKKNIEESQNLSEHTEQE